MDARAALPQNCSKRRLSFASNSENGTSVLPVTHQRAMSALALKRRLRRLQRIHVRYRESTRYIRKRSGGKIKNDSTFVRQRQAADQKETVRLPETC